MAKIINYEIPSGRYCEDCKLKGVYTNEYDRIIICWVFNRHLIPCDLTMGGTNLVATKCEECIEYIRYME